jgi:hypothetical protein
MIVSITIGASEKRSARSRWEPNEYSARLGIDQLVVDRPEDLVSQATTLFAMAKETIAAAMRADGLDPARPGAGDTDAPPLGGRLSNQGGLSPTNGSSNGSGRSGTPATEPQLRLIDKLASSRRLNNGSLEAFCQEATGQGLGGLSKFDASRLITALKGGDR